MPTQAYPVNPQTPGQISAQIQTTRNGSGLTQGYREDLGVGDTIAASLTNAQGVSSYEWALIGRPEGSVAGGAGPEPIPLGFAPTATFTVDDDSGDFPRDGTYILQCLVNARTPTETRLRVGLVRLNPAQMLDGRTLRALGGNETDEDTADADVAQGFAKMGNRLMRGFLALPRSPEGFRMGNPETADAWTGPRPDNVYLAGQRNAEQTNVVPATPAADTLYAVPIFVHNEGVISDLLVKQRAGTTGSLRLGLYKNLAKSVYPDALLFDSGDLVFTGSELRVANVAKRVAPGLLWLVILANSDFNSNACTIDHLLGQSMFPILGTASDLLDAGGANINFGVGWTHAQAFGALPDPFPLSAPAQIKTAGGISVPSAYFRWSL